MAAPSIEVASNSLMQNLTVVGSVFLVYMPLIFMILYWSMTLTFNLVLYEFHASSYSAGLPW